MASLSSPRWTDVVTLPLPPVSIQCICLDGPAWNLFGKGPPVIGLALNLCQEQTLQHGFTTYTFLFGAVNIQKWLSDR